MKTQQQLLLGKSDFLSSVVAAAAEVTRVNILSLPGLRHRHHYQRNSKTN